MNLKNQQWRYWLPGPAALLVGIVVFYFGYIPVEPVITGDVAREEWPQFRAACQDSGGCKNLRGRYEPGVAKIAGALNRLPKMSAPGIFTLYSPIPSSPIRLGLWPAATTAARELIFVFRKPRIG